MGQFPYGLVRFGLLGFEIRDFGLCPIDRFQIRREKRLRPQKGIRFENAEHDQAVSVGVIKPERAAEIAQQNKVWDGEFLLLNTH
jgi:hypothetical protein